MVTIAVDAMGGDHAPAPEVAGAIAAVKDYGVRVILVGREDIVRPELAKHPGWEKLANVRRKNTKNSAQSRTGV